MKHRWFTIRPATSIALVLCLLSSSGCAGWRTVSREELVREVRGYHPTKVRVSLADSTLEVRDPAVRADSLVGTAKHWGAVKPVSFALARVDSAEVPGNLRKPALLLAIPMAALMIAAVVSVIAQDPVYEPQ